MKARLMVVIAVAGLCLSGMAETASFTRVKVLKNNCNLRAKALVTSEVVGQASENDILTAKTLDKDWVEVVPPTNVDLWVLGDYVKDGVINCRQKVNVRAGAGINFNIVGQLPQGEKVEVRGIHAEWVKIAPSASFSLWISRSLVTVVPLAEVAPAKLDLAQAEPVKPIPPPLPADAVVPSSKPGPEVKQPLPAPQPARNATHPPASSDKVLQAGSVEGVAVAPQPERSASNAVVLQAGSDGGQVVTAPPSPAPAQDAVFFTPPGLDLVAATGQGRWREVEGRLRPKDFIFRAPSDFRLVSCDDDGKNSETICFVKGNHAQLEALMYRHLIVSGREYWVKRQKYPVIVPERILMK